MTTIDKLKKEHKVLKREVAEAEKIRNFAREAESLPSPNLFKG